MDELCVVQKFETYHMDYFWQANFRLDINELRHAREQIIFIINRNIFAGLAFREPLYQMKIYNFEIAKMPIVTEYIFKSYQGGIRSIRIFIFNNRISLKRFV